MQKYQKKQQLMLMKKQKNKDTKKEITVNRLKLLNRSKLKKKILKKIKKLKLIKNRFF